MVEFRVEVVICLLLFIHTISRFQGTTLLMCIECSLGIGFTGISWFNVAVLAWFL